MAQVSLTCPGVVAFVGVGPVHQHDDVRGLHDCVLVAQVANLGWRLVAGPEVGAGRHQGAFELGGGDDVDAQLHREVFEPAQDLADGILLVGWAARTGEDECGGVDGDEVDPVAATAAVMVEHRASRCGGWRESR
jgi:hypothetical protein